MRNLTKWCEAMRESQLGMQSLPSRNLAFYFPSPTHEEALARLDFQVEQRYSLSILSGCEGAGKSTVVDVFAGKLRQSGRTAHVMNLLGADVRGFLWSLAAGLGANPPGDEDATLLWRRIDDRLEEIGIEDRLALLQNQRETFQPHSRVDPAVGERGQRSVFQLSSFFFCLVFSHPAPESVSFFSPSEDDVFHFIPLLFL